ncbi:MAG TPA: glutaredoxin family protein [Casimicrobiaceae bacterium]|nr:glutaredoxin family protein [Casimicrobiaceae bacterium]
MMIRGTIAALSIVTLGVLSLGAASQTLYRYVDANGRVVYSDQPPPPEARNVQPKRLDENVIETDKVSLETKQAADNFPLTLYTFDCDVCREAQALLVKRGVPFKTVIVTEEKGAAALKALTGKQAAPVLAIGDKQVLQGYNESRWQASLDDAGYPREAATPAAISTASSASKVSAPKAEPEPVQPADNRPAGPGEGYPK